tara:strand:- start:11 stop:241 length:231 start_codon:yes stop_codon:yes gene_type:complete
MSTNRAIFTPSGKVIEAIPADEVKVMEDTAAVWAAVKKASKDARDQKEVDAKSGNTKLLNLGLTQAEATALTGYKP